MALTGRPSSNVTVTVRSHKPEAATVQTTGAAGTTATLVFTPTDWNTPQTVTVTGVDDSVVNSNGSRNSVISHTASSSDANYQGASERLTAKVTDDDAANVAIDLSTDLTSISEDAGAQTVTVSINKAPAQDIQIGYTVSSNSAVQDVDFVGLDGDIKFDGGTSTLTRRQLVTVLNDTLPSEGPETVTITLTDGAGYRLGAQASVTITIDDNT